MYHAQAAAGLLGFLATLAGSPLVAYIQKNGNNLFGLPLYAQQATTFIAILLLVIGTVYVCFFLLHQKKTGLPALKKPKNPLQIYCFVV